MNNKSITRNAFLNIIRSLLALIAPLITYPYVSRVIGAENLGKINYVNSIVQYFVLFAALGISTYGIREGARLRQNRNKLNDFVSECFSINLIMTLISISVLFFIILKFNFFDKYRFLFLIESFLIIFDLFGIEWVNTIFEDYLYITIRTIIVYLISIVLTFILIKSRTDYYKYAILMVGTTGLVSVLNWMHCKKVCTIKIRFTNNSKCHIKPILIFFANKLAVNLYVSADTTMLGAMVSDYRVGIYSVSVKIYSIIKNLLSSIYVVCIPRLAYKIGEKDEVGYRILYTNIVCIMTLLIFPAMLGLFLLSPNIILVLFGNEYIDSILSLRILSFALVFAIYGGLISSVYNVTKRLEKVSLKATILAAILNISLNIFLIPKYQQNGAAITTVIAELVTLIYCCFNAKDIKKIIDKKALIKCIKDVLLGCIEVLFTILIFQKLILNNFFCILLSVLVSICFYSITLIITKNEFVILFISNIRKKIN